MKNIYFDHNSTTPVKPEVFAVMRPFLENNFGNPSSLHDFGRKARNAVESAREQIASALNVSPKNLIFTSGGTEANNLAITGTIFRKLQTSNPQELHIISSQAEHSSVLETCSFLKEKLGVQVDLLPVNEKGHINLEHFQKIITKETTLCSFMAANNETGTITQFAQIAKICQEDSVPLHSDCVQMFGKQAFFPAESAISMASISAHKIGGPKGIGALYLCSNDILSTMQNGGGQEINRRGGTENVPGIVGFGKAAELAISQQAIENNHILKLRNTFETLLAENIADFAINGDLENRLANTSSITFHGIKSQSLIMNLDMAGLAVSAGSACASLTFEPSHVLLAMGINENEALGSIRVSFGAENTLEEVNGSVNILKKVIEKLRRK